MKADEACEIIAKAVGETVPEVQIAVKPMADGGEGTARAMIKAAGGRWIPQTVTGPLPDMQVEAGFAWFDDKTALVEMASASGLELLSAEQMNPLKTTTYGTGELIKAALDRGARKILLAVGGSATVDGGLGAAMALGWDFLDEQGNPVGSGGEALARIRKIVKPDSPDPVPVEVLCDCDNPLCGEKGAARVYAPQKGATEEMVEQLEKGLEHLSELVSQQLGRNIDVPGAGAAGGLAGGGIAFMDAEVVSGIDQIIAYSNLASELDCADWVITGEGAFDIQSLYGKVVSGVLKTAGQSNIRVGVIAGQVNIAQREYEKIGIAAAVSCKDGNMTLEYALENSRELLYSAAKRFATQYLSD
jgi:glycerate kinase